MLLLWSCESFIRLSMTIEIVIFIRKLREILSKMSIEDITGNPEKIADENLEQTASTARGLEDEGKEDSPYMPKKVYKKDEYPTNGDKEEYLMPKSPDLGASEISLGDDFKYDPFIKVEEKEEKQEEEEKESEEQEEDEEEEDK